jgi:mono/diheme cytochrome c family protein
MKRSSLCLFALLAGLALAGTLARPAASEVKPDMNGAAVYARLCSACHGPDGSGGGPLADTTKRPVADLSRMAERNGGVFPRERVLTQLNDPRTKRISGMPPMRLKFRELGTDQARTKMVFSRLADYVGTLQKPSDPPPGQGDEAGAEGTGKPDVE